MKMPISKELFEQLAITASKIPACCEEMSDFAFKAYAHELIKAVQNASNVGHMYELTYGENIYQGTFGDDSEWAITETANSFPESGTPFKFVAFPLIEE